jgi:hypothetical protein
MFNNRSQITELFKGLDTNYGFDLGDWIRFNQEGYIGWSGLVSWSKSTMHILQIQNLWRTILHKIYGVDTLRITTKSIK